MTLLKKHESMCRHCSTTTFLLILHALLCKLVLSNVCFVYYELADNNLEYSLRKDLQEYMNSSAIEDPSVTSWIYFDGRNQLGTSEDIVGPLPNVFQSNGLPESKKYEGSLYLTFNHTMSEMVVDTVLPGEQNSESAKTVTAFLTKAFSDCVSKGSTQYLVIFSDHGSGFAGFGEDDNKRRRLQESNQDLSNAIITALQSVNGTPSKINVLGFDACLMGEFGALDDYSKVADYVLASEAVVPAHGFAYYTLDYATTALEMAKGLAQSFLTETQDGDNSPLTTGHQTPKTIAIINSTGYTEFLAAWEVLSSDLTNRLNDSTLVKILTRARTQTLSFQGYLDIPGSLFSQLPSNMDIGQFFVEFGSFCNIDPQSALQTSLDGAQNAYKAMFVSQGDGPGTANGTGMTILWPLAVLYKYAPALYDEYLFNTSNAYAASPNWLKFLQTYYETAIPKRNTTMSVCLNTIENTVNPQSKDQLLLDPSVDVSPTSVIFTSEVTFETDYVRVQYGIDITNFATSDRRLNELVQNRHATDKNLLNVATAGRNQRSTMTQDSDVYLLFGGAALLEFNLISVQASWDQKMYLVTSDGLNFSSVYVSDKGNGQKSFPVCYFDPGSTVTVQDLDGYPSYEELTVTINCTKGQVYFSEESGGWSLFIGDDASGLSPISILNGGQITPIVYVSFLINGTLVDNIVGGFPDTIIVDWTPSANATLEYLYNYDLLNILKHETKSFVFAQAYDFDRYLYANNVSGTPGYDSYIYMYNVSSQSQAPSPGGGTATGPTPTANVNGSANVNGNQATPTSSGVVIRFAFVHFAIYSATTLFCWCLV